LAGRIGLFAGSQRWRHIGCGNQRSMHPDGQKKLAGKGTDGAEGVGWFSGKMYWIAFLIEVRDTLCIAWIG
jgi:hypothetical protein